MTDKLEARIGSRLKGAALPAAPEHLRSALRDLQIEQPARRTAAPGRSLIVLVAAALAIAAIGVIGLSGGGTAPPTSSQSPSPSPSPSPSASVAGPPIGESLDGLVVQSVSQLLDRRASGAIKGEQVALGGFWSDRSIAHSCAAPAATPGALEIYCHATEFGITERNEPILTLLQNGDAIPPTGRSLSPFVPDQLAQRLFQLPVINDQRYPPVPIVVVGHFDDARAAECRPEVRKTCLDRFVMDRIVSFDPSVVPPPTPTPVPSPFPFGDPPPGKFTAEDCGLGAPSSFIGWTTLGKLGLDVASPDTVVWAAVTADPVPLGEWFKNSESGPEYRLWGRRVCFAYEWDDTAITFLTVPGQGFKEYRDGHREPTAVP